MYPEEELSPYTKRIYQVLGELRVALPTARQTAFLNRGYNRLLEEHGCLDTITDDEIMGVFDRIMLHTSPIALEMY